MKNDEILEIYNKFGKIHNQFSAIKRSHICQDQGIYPGEMQVLALIRSNRNMSISEIAEELYITKSGASQAVKKLTLKRLLSKKRNIENERNVTLLITESGEEAVESFLNNPENPIQDFLKEFSDLQARELSTVRKFLFNLEKLFDKKLK